MVPAHRHSTAAEELQPASRSGRTNGPPIPNANAASTANTRPDAEFLACTTPLSMS